MLLRKSFFLQDYDGAMCHFGKHETRDHLFINCPFTQCCWKYIYPSWQPEGVTFELEVAYLKHLLKVPFSLEVIILVCWAIWTNRNDFISKQIHPNLYSYRSKLKSELQWITLRGKRQEYSGLADWVTAYT